MEKANRGLSEEVLAFIRTFLTSAYLIATTHRTHVLLQGGQSGRVVVNSRHDMSRS